MKRVALESQSLGGEEGTGPGSGSHTGPQVSPDWDSCQTGFCPRGLGLITVT